MSQLTCRDLTFAYEGKEVLKNINFNVDKGDYLCIVGENGAGKSTLIKGILGLKKQAKGKIAFGDGLKPKEIGYLPQQTQVQKDFPASVNEVVLSGRLNNLGYRLFYNKKDKEICKKNMELLGISDLGNKCYRNLSGGQQQRVLLARALCATTSLLLLDEPMTGLDPIATYELYQLINRINKEEKITIIMVSHDIHGSIDYSSHILHLGQEQKFFGKTKDYKISEAGEKFLKRGQNNA